MLWNTYHPGAAILDSEAQNYLVQSIMGESDRNQDRKITFDEFIPWYDLKQAPSRA